MILEDDSNFSLFRSRQAETFMWCTRLGRGNDAAGGLRTPLLRPAFLAVEGENQSSWNYEYRDPYEAVEELCKKRVEISSEVTNALSSDYDPLTMGRVLLFYPHETLCDGAACSASEGFFDYWNIPPWDTWFGLYRQHDGRDVLYSLVPPDFLQLALDGVLANPEKCLKWLDVT